MFGVALLIAGSLTAALIYLVVTAAIVYCSGLYGDVLNIGLGPKIYTQRFGSFTVNVRLLFFMGGSIQFEIGELEDATRPLLVALHLAGHLVVFGVACVFLGPRIALSSTMIGMWESILGGFTPWSNGQSYLNAIYSASENLPVIVLFGLLFTKVSAINLLPIPGLGGGNAILCLFDREGILAARIGALSLLFVLCLLLGWFIAFVFAII